MCKIKKVKFCLLIIFIVIYSSACTQKENSEMEISTESQNVEAKTDPEVVQDYINEEVENNFVINAQVIYPERDAYATYSVQRKIFLKHDVEQYFQGEISDMTITDNPNANNAFTIETDKGSSIGVQDGYLNYSKNTEKDNEIVSIIESSVFDENKGGEEKLSFADPEEVIKIGKEKIKLITGADAEVTRIVAVNSNMLSDYQKELSLQESYHATGKTFIINDWSEKDDVYYMQYSIIRDGLPLYSQNHEAGISMQIDAYWAFDTDITIMIDREGIRYFNCRNAFTDLQIESQPKTIITPEEAINRVKELYSNIILTEKNTISKIYLEYVPVPDWKDMSKIEIVPYWCIQIDVLDEQGDTWIKAERINAITGGNLSYGE